MQTLCYDCSKEEPVRRLLVLIVVVILVMATAGTALAAPKGLSGPAPRAGDGVSDGSGFDRTDVGGGVGPAPNSGDGVSDGSGF
jgi:hypothetical protein